MKVLLAAVLTALAIPAVGLAAAAGASSDTPGAAYYISELDLDAALERHRFDSAYCDGIARFGKHGSFPYEKFHVFDCTTQLNGKLCSDMRIKTVNSTRRGYWSWKMIRRPDCF